MVIEQLGTVFDLLKLSLLADLFATRRISEYWESHAATSLTPEPGDSSHGIGRFASAAPGNVALARSPLFRALEPLRSGGRISSTPGSSWLALKVLGADARRYLFCANSADALKSIDAARRELNVLETKVEYVQDDGVMLLRGACLVLAEEWTSSTVAFIDPPTIAFGDSEAFSPLQLWCELANRGIISILAYTFADEGDRIAVRRRFADAIDRAKLAGRNIYRFEGALVQKPAVAPPIPWGFGLLTANLSDETILAADTHLFELQGLFAGTTLPGWGDGMWKYAGQRG